MKSIGPVWGLGAATSLTMVLCACSADDPTDSPGGTAGSGTGGATTTGAGGRAAGGSTTGTGTGVGGGGGPASDAVLLHPDPFPGTATVDFAVTVDSQEVVFTADDAGRTALFAVGVDGTNHRLIDEPVDGNIQDFRVSPHGPAVLYSGSRGLVTVDGTSGNHVELDLDGPSLLGSCTFVADQLHVVCRDLVGPSNYAYFLVPLDGSAATSLSSSPVYPSPDGQHLATKAGSQLRIREIATATDVYVGDSVGIHTWNPNSSSILYTQTQYATEPGLYQVAADGTGATLLTTDLPTQFLVSPDGAWVVYTTSLANSSVYDLYSLSTSGSAAPIPYNVSAFEPNHSTSGLRLDGITPDSQHLVFAAGSIGEQYHQPLFAGALDGSGSMTTLVNISGWPTLRTAEFFGISADSAWVVASVRRDQPLHGIEVSAVHPDGTERRSLLLPGEPQLWDTDEGGIQVGPASVLVLAGDTRGLIRTDLTTDDDPQWLVGPTRVDRFLLTPTADHVVYVQDSADDSVSRLYALGLR